MSGEWIDYRSQRDDALKVCAYQAEQIRTLKGRIAELLDERRWPESFSDNQKGSQTAGEVVATQEGGKESTYGHSWGTIDIQGAIEALAHRAVQRLEGEQG